MCSTKWNRKIYCGSSCRRINLPLCLWRSHTSFYSNAFLPASNNFWIKVKSSAQHDLLIDQFLLCLMICFQLAVQYFWNCVTDLVAFHTKNWIDENLVNDSQQTSRFALWRGKNIVWLFSMPLWCNKHFSA